MRVCRVTLLTPCVSFGNDPGFKISFLSYAAHKKWHLQREFAPWQSPTAPNGVTSLVAKLPGSCVLHEDAREGCGETLTAAFQCLKGAYRKEGENVFSRTCCNRTRRNGFKLREGRYRLDVRKKLFTMKVVKH